MAEELTTGVAELAALELLADCSDADLQRLAPLLEPVRVGAGDILMRQGEPADFFLIVADGEAVVEHRNPDGSLVEVRVGSGRILGEIALLRHSMRVATVRAGAELSGWIGGDDAFDALIELPGVLEALVRTARQRLAAFITPIPFHTRDGTELLLRPVLPGDAVRASTGPVEFSAETVFRRFMSPREPTPALMQYLFEVDYIDHFVWVVVDAEDDVIADARFIRDAGDRSVAEIAFIVGDDYQGTGLGSFLMKAIAVAANVGGVEKFTARVLSGNMAMRAIVDQYGARWEREDLGVVTTEFDVPGIRELSLPAELADQIRDVARQVTEALG